MTVRWKTSLQWLALAALCWALVVLSWCVTHRLPPHTNP